MNAIWKHPFHLIAIAAGAGAVAVVLWKVDHSGQHFAAYTGVMVAMLAAVDLARRLGLEPKNDPARPKKRT
ncbi:hypothetical protein HTK96_04815 [Brevundimonas vesicularis]|uniref:hypothetical protein n=1 Tax=Brevundimonas vesicularis TaxID=41276 RepID=UPI001571F134|nr:hypothetical protein [Brevundimonas vesicularis]NSX32689.1 hypothetical protein [Brevundimonas vesicularis]